MGLPWGRRLLYLRRMTGSSRALAPCPHRAGRGRVAQIVDAWRLPLTLQHFQALLRLDTSSPPGNEIRAVEYLEQVLKREGIPYQVFAKDPQRPNLVARIKGNGKKRPILVMGHTDVVTVDPKKWTYPPFGARETAATCTVAAAVDDKDNLVAGLMLMLTLKRAGRRRSIAM